MTIKNIISQDERLRLEALSFALKEREAIEQRIKNHKAEYQRIIAIDGYKAGEFKAQIIKDLEKLL